MIKEISYNTAPGNMNKNIGYGVAGWNIIQSLKSLGISVPYDDKNSPIQINFSQPEWFHLRDGQFQIGYTPWESTLLPSGWPEKMNKCDEVWTTSHFCKEVFTENGVRGPIYVYRHGIEDIWKRVELRTNKPTIKFLHIGSPATRKGGQMAFDSFRAAFGNSTDVHLTIKAFGHSEIRYKDRTGNIIGAVADLPNVTVINKVYDEDQLLDLYLNHDVMIYNSFGEGFGLIPLQAIATGMPAIVTEAWCEYKKYILPLNSQRGTSKWQSMHRGDVFVPDFDHLVCWLREVRDNFDFYAKQAYSNTTKLHKEYDWLRLTEKAIKDLEKRI